jgi:ABC-type uncharacterized transport system ATPase subunit
MANGDVIVHDPSLTIRRDDVRGVAVETEMYSGNGRVYVENSVLVLETTGDDVRLAASPDKQLIASLAEKAAALTRTEINRQVTQ